MIEKYKNTNILDKVMKSQYLILIAIIFGVLLVSIASAGTYQIGDNITFSVVCRNNSGSKDTGCNTNTSKVFNTTDTTGLTSYIIEVSDANAPGLWRGTYLIPSAFGKGTGTVYIQLTNSQGAILAYIRQFQVVVSGFPDIQTNMSTENTKLTTILSNVSNITYVILSNLTNTTNILKASGNCSLAQLVTINDTLKQNTSNLATYILANSNLTAAQVWAYASRLLTSLDLNIAGNYSNLQGYVWNSTTRTITAGTDVNISTKAVTDIDTQINQSHGRSLYNTTGEVTIGAVNLTSYAIGDIDTRVNQSHGLGLYNTTAGTCASSAEVTSVNDTLKQNTSNLAAYILAGGNCSLAQLITINDTLKQNASNLAAFILANNNLTASGVWTFATRTLTSFNWDAIVGNLTSLQGYVWNASNRLITGGNVSENTSVCQSYIVTVNQTIKDYGIGASNLTASQVWASPTRTLTSIDLALAGNYSNLQGYIWNYTNRLITGGNISQNLTALDIWTYATRTLTSINLALAGNYSNLQGYVWNATNRLITGGNVSANDTILTYITSVNDTVKTYSISINDTVKARTSSLANITAADVWNYGTKTLTSYGTLISDIWSFATRVLTSFDINIMGNYSNLQSYIWNTSIRNLTYYNMTDTTNYSRIATPEQAISINDTLKTYIASLSNVTSAQIWAYATREITGGNLSTPGDYKADLSTLANLTAGQVWQYSIRLITGGNLSTPADYKADLSTLANVTTQQIWEYSQRLITGGNLTNPDSYKANLSTLANLTAKDVWNYLNISNALIPSINISAPGNASNTLLAIWWHTLTGGY